MDLQLFFEAEADLFVRLHNFRYSFQTVARRFSPLFWLLCILLSLLTLIGTVGVSLYLSIPAAQDLDGCLTTSMYRLPLCRQNANYVTLNQISPFLKNAVVVSEDGSFWDHEGIDWVEMRKSFEKNLEKGRFARGGSTITQQLAKNIYLTPEKSLWRKVKEAVIAIRIERRFPKKLILEKYLNVVEFDKGVYGAKQAAKHFFDKSPSSLSIAESSWLAFLLPNPRRYSASFHRDQLSPFALKQMIEIINRLARYQKISETDRTLAIQEASLLFGGVKGRPNEIYEEFIDLEREEGPEDPLPPTSTEATQQLKPSTE
jgi:monofunctional biosynthetic peptidoglycan transglycosylase